MQAASRSAAAAAPLAAAALLSLACGDAPARGRACCDAQPSNDAPQAPVEGSELRAVHVCAVLAASLSELWLATAKTTRQPTRMRRCPACSARTPHALSTNRRNLNKVAYTLSRRTHTSWLISSKHCTQRPSNGAPAGRLPPRRAHTAHAQVLGRHALGRVRRRVQKGAPSHPRSRHWRDAAELHRRRQPHALRGRMHAGRAHKAGPGAGAQAEGRPTFRRVSVHAISIASMQFQRRQCLAGTCTRRTGAMCATVASTVAACEIAQCQRHDGNATLWRHAQVCMFKQRIRMHWRHAARSFACRLCASAATSCSGRMHPGQEGFLAAHPQHMPPGPPQVSSHHSPARAVAGAWPVATGALRPAWRAAVRGLRAGTDRSAHHKLPPHARHAARRADGSVSGAHGRICCDNGPAPQRRPPAASQPLPRPRRAPPARAYARQAICALLCTH